MTLYGLDRSMKVFISFIVCIGIFNTTCFARPKIKDKEFIHLIETAPTPEMSGDTAVYLLYEQKTSFTKKGSETVWHIVIKILDEGAVSEFGQFIYVYNEKYQKVEVNTSRTILADGTVHSTPKDGIRKTRLYPDASEYQDITKLFVPFPSVEKNSVVELKFTIEEDFYEGKQENSGFFFSIPLGFRIMKTRVEIDWPEKMKANCLYKGFLQNEVEVTEGRHQNKLVMEKDDYNTYNASEAYRPPYKFIAPYVLFSLCEDWQALYEVDKRELDDLILDTKTISNEARKVIMQSGAKTVNEKIDVLYQFVSQSIRYIDISFISMMSLKSNRADNVLINKYGDCKGMSALLISLLKSMDIPAYFALVPSAALGDVDMEVPMNGQFNHVITAIPTDEGYLFLDPTAPLNNYLYLPAKDQDVSAFIFKEYIYDFIKTPLLPPGRNATITRVISNLEETGKAEFKVLEETNGDNGIVARAAFLRTSEYNIKQSTEKLLSVSVPGAKLDDLDYSDPWQTGGYFMTGIGFTSLGYAKKVDDYLFYSIPSITPLVNPVLFASNNRVYPLYMPFLFEVKREYEINIPDGYNVKKVPEKIEIDNEYFSLEYVFRQDENMLKGNENFIVKKKIIPSDFYGAAKTMIDDYLSVRAEDIVFEKKN